MKSVFKKVVYFFSYFLSKIPTSKPSLFFIKLGYAIRSESLFYKTNVREFKDRLEMHSYLSTDFTENQKIQFLEFGVYKGQTFALWMGNNRNPHSRFFGFDTFTGLPESWGRWKKGSFSANGKLPDLADERGVFLVGLIQDTLPLNIGKINPDENKVIHIDVDIYSATLVTLINLLPILKKGDIIIFDDFFTVMVADHAFKAFFDFLATYTFSYRPLFKCRRGHFVIEVA
ncbi:MAG: TylF/MycF/NovP-related O-methyltransferase [Cyclobacteriaceae bacterium]